MSGGDAALCALPMPNVELSGNIIHITALRADHSGESLVLDNAPVIGTQIPRKPSSTGKPKMTGITAIE